jgi:hypothetical protein
MDKIRKHKERQEHKKDVIEDIKLIAIMFIFWLPLLIHLFFIG